MSMPSHELIQLEAPATLWRGIGALAALSIANIEQRTPELEAFEDEMFDTWDETWSDDEGVSYVLKVRRDVEGDDGPSTLFGLEPGDEGTGLYMYTRYMFPTDPYTQSDIGYLAVFRGAIDPYNPDDPGALKQQAAQIRAEVEMGTAKGSLEDLGELSAKLWQGMISVATRQRQQE